jgi:hypothetical protein
MTRPGKCNASAVDGFVERMRFKSIPCEMRARFGVTKRKEQPNEGAMKNLMISALAAAALLAAATTMPWSRSLMPRDQVEPAGLSIQEIYAAADVNKLPIEEFEDRSLVYSTATKR